MDTFTYVAPIAMTDTVQVIDRPVTEQTKTKTTGKAAKARKREAQIKELQAGIDKMVTDYMNGDGYIKWLQFVTRFHSYSLRNVMLIMSQRPTATRVAGYKTWLSMGRRVRKGEHGLRIVGYRPYRFMIDEDGDPDDPKNYRAGASYPLVSVFDISQTEVVNADKWNSVSDGADKRLTGEDAAGVFDRVQEWLTGEGWTVTLEPIAGEMNGYTAHETKRIVIDSGMAPAQRAKTILHEAAHAVMHGDVDYMHERARCEVEAESTSYIVASLIGMDTTQYSEHYLMSWGARTPELFKETAAAVIKAVGMLCDGLKVA